jgi:lipopolysaccharide/colanic/teichoic acid biosynthesis glycosyltransferase
MTKIFDYLLAILGLLLFTPLFILVAIAIRIDSKGKIFFRQWRVGKHGKYFRVFKFRTMYSNSDKIRLLTTSKKDERITKVGLLLRRFKLDELPQLINVLTGDMSIVGPRPEIPEFVKLYSKSQQKVLQIKPGITDLASLIFINENELLEKVENPEGFYMNEILPLKIRLNKVYILKSTVAKYFSIIGWTFFSIFHITNTRLKQIEIACKSRILRNTIP